MLYWEKCRGEKCRGEKCYRGEKSLGRKIMEPMKHNKSFHSVNQILNLIEKSIFEMWYSKVTENQQIHFQSFSKCSHYIF